MSESNKRGKLSTLEQDQLEVSQAVQTLLELNGRMPTQHEVDSYFAAQADEHDRRLRNAVVLTVREAAEFLRCSERTVVRMINRGTLKASKATGKTLVRRVDLERVLDG